VDDAAFADGGGGWRQRVTMVVVAMVPGLCWDNELGGRSLVSAIVLPAIEQTMGVREGGGCGGEEEGGVGSGGGGGEANRISTMLQE